MRSNRIATCMVFACVGLVLRAPSEAAQPAPAAPVSAAPFLLMAGEGDVFEITSSQMALMRSQNAEVRNFAQMLIEHHTRLTNATLTEAKAAGVAAPPPVLTAPKRAMIDALLGAGAADFDRVYLQQQATAHNEALALHTNYAARGEVPQLRRAAMSAIPVVQQHLAQVRTLSSR